MMQLDRVEPAILPFRRLWTATGGQYRRTMTTGTWKQSYRRVGIDDNEVDDKVIVIMARRPKYWQRNQLTKPTSDC